MICETCRRDAHGDCKGGTWCDCQHARRYADAEIAELVPPDVAARLRRLGRRLREEASAVQAVQDSAGRRDETAGPSPR
jgi:hypothetical protein